MTNAGPRKATAGLGTAKVESIRSTAERRHKANSKK